MSTAASAQINHATTTTTILAGITLPVTGRVTTAGGISMRASDDVHSADVQSLFAKHCADTSKRLETRIEKIGGLSAPMLVGRPRSCCQNHFLATVHLAFAEELPLTLSPDHVWSAIAQGIALHINVEGDAMRDVFFDFDEKRTLVIIDHGGLVQGNPDASPWHEVLSQFVEALRGSINDPSMVDDLLPVYSTTTKVEHAAHTIALMDTLKSFFEYSVKTLCGIPRVNLLGTADDWGALRAAVQRLLPRLRLNDWLAALDPVLERFVALANAGIDGLNNDANAVDFWKRMYRAHGPADSGPGPHATGWITVFFPYVSLNHKYTMRNHYDNEKISYDEFPPSVGRTPFKWLYLGTSVNMSFCGGVVGIGRLDGAVTPAMGWAIAYEDKYGSIYGDMLVRV